ncbi:hypothetical protein HNQ60_000661 [Povalibacter uvarum]|uniref:Glycosyl hydrolase n=1 Tax=Povalibacter uvarum TaxID=732238 RepID=A0A841HIC6_9GAMM|nr:glycoside hydrolase family 127 protein [Povalibacter uvarum]MBB6091815.1 hypothetical protein [Povalibacter uvarum]
MTLRIPRRTFVAAAFGTASLPLWPATSLGQASGQVTTIHNPLQPFDLKDVRLGAGPALEAAQVNRRYLLELDPDRLLHMFRLTAGLPSTAEPLGGWEAPDNELRGHFTGHYLSACALLAAQTGDAEVRARGDLMVTELAKCQAALGNGFLSAFPEELFDRLRAGKPAWAPFYTLHKIMAGLLDSYTLSGNEAALQTLLGMAKWTAAWTQPLSEDHMARVLEREYGGMNELLYNLGAVTKDAKWTELARRFDHERVFAPLAAGRDELQGLHVNTTIPKVIGAARGYEVTGDRRLQNVAGYFWHTVTERRCFCTGGTSSGESWNTPPGQLAKELSGYTQECCVTYNMQKLTRHLFQWTGDARAADYYERAYYNGILGVQHPSDGDKLYYVPLQSGFWKLFGTPLHDFWCCTGSMAESFAKLGDSIYFHDERGVFVNLFVPSTVTWAEKDVRLTQETRFPDSDTVRLTVHLKRPTAMPLRVRVPSWVQGGSASLNGRALDGFASPGSYFVVDRRWRDGDVLEVRLPMRLHYAVIPDDPTLRAVMYGPIVLAGRLGAAGLTKDNLRAGPTKPRTIPEYTSDPVAAPAIVGGSDDPSNWLRPVAGRPLEFQATGQATPLTLVPLHRVFDERYAVYWKV